LAFRVSEMLLKKLRWDKFLFGGFAEQTELAGRRSQEQRSKTKRS
jgi:hypothetical protein